MHATHKDCATCKKSLPLADFNKCANAYLGLDAYCRSCRREYYQEHKEDYAAANRRFNLSHPGHATERMRVWRAKHPERVREIGRKSDAKRAAKRKAQRLAAKKAKEKDQDNG